VVVLNNQLLYSAVALLFTLFGVAALYVFLWADFIAGVQLIVYIGGILVLIIFGIMLTNRISSVRLSQTNVQQGIGGVVSIWLLILLGLVVSKTSWLESPSVEPVGSTVHDIGVLLLTKYLLPFEAVSLLLLGALIGAALLSREGA
jgi:NADH-quinone oxidoreductase subunit J